jgi:hypothetical protein
VGAPAKAPGDAALFQQISCQRAFIARPLADLRRSLDTLSAKPSGGIVSPPRQVSMKPPVVVLGATGQVGLFAISRLLEHERKVIAVTRTAADTPDSGIGGLRRVELSRLGEVLTTPENVLGGKPALLSCGPVMLALELLQSRRPGVVGYWERVVITGTTSTLSKKASSDEAERNMIEEIETACVGIREVCSSGQIPLTILSPTLIYGCGMDQLVLLLLHRLQMACDSRYTLVIWREPLSAPCRLNLRHSWNRPFAGREPYPTAK